MSDGLERHGMYKLEHHSFPFPLIVLVKNREKFYSDLARPAIVRKRPDVIHHVTRHIKASAPQKMTCFTTGTLIKAVCCPSFTIPITPNLLSLCQIKAIEMADISQTFPLGRTSFHRRISPARRLAKKEDMKWKEYPIRTDRLMIFAYTRDASPTFRR
jgi:hypothetical protein